MQIGDLCCTVLPVIELREGQGSPAFSGGLGVGHPAAVSIDKQREVEQSTGQPRS